MAYLVILVIWTSIVAIGLAFTIGANDAANSISTSVGSDAISLKSALRIGALCELLGTLVMGAFVSATLQRKIVSPTLYIDDEMEFIIGMTASLMSASVVLFIATLAGMPVSTTQTIVGSIIGFGIISKGFDAIQMKTLLNILLSWIITPILGGALGYLLYWLIDRLIMAHKEAHKLSLRLFPYTAAFTFSILGGFIIASEILHNGWPLWIIPIIMIVIALVTFLISILFKRRWFPQLDNDIDDDRTELKLTQIQWNHMRAEEPFKYLMICTMCAVAFAHGGNDVANAISPYAMVIQYEMKKDLKSRSMPYWILLLGGIGISVGLIVLGYKVVDTVGTKLTRLTWTRGFASQLAAAITVMISTLLGLPVSTTSTLVGSITGVSYVKDRTIIHDSDESNNSNDDRYNNNEIVDNNNSNNDGDIVQRQVGVNKLLLAKIVASWFITVLVGAIVSIICFLLLTALR